MHDFALPIVVFIIGTISLFLDPKDHQGRKKIFILTLMVTLLVLTCYHSITSNLQQSRENQELYADITRLQEENRALLEIASLGKGYHVVIRGVASFDCLTLEGEVKRGLDNIFIRFANIGVDIYGSNNKVYKGVVNQLSNPQVTTFFGVERLENFVDSSTSLSKSTPIVNYLKYRKGNSYYFEIRTDSVRLSNKGIQYLTSEPIERIRAHLSKYDDKGPTHNFYKVGEIYVGDVEIVELEQAVSIDKSLTFDASDTCK